ncbi:MAG: hypothetical protein OXP70_08005, partial [Acidobacteriota bacterium]|nr:hypothetical protein [Acidobacteriota bacterium]
MTRTPQPRTVPPAGALAVSVVTLVLACAADNGIGPDLPQVPEWIRLPTESGSSVSIAVVRPEVAPMGVVVA